MWIAAHHIAKIKAITQNEGAQEAQATIYYKNGKTLLLEVSLHTLQTQWERALYCMYKIENDYIKAK